MLEDLVGYAAPAAAATAGLGLTLAHRGTWYYDKIRKVNVSNGNGFSRRIIDKFPKYRMISSPLEHFVEGISLPYAIVAAGGASLAAARLLGFDVQQPEHSYAAAWAGTLIIKVCMEAYALGRARRKLTKNDCLQMAADVGSLAATFVILPLNA